jgi:hypothetical protein
VGYIIALRLDISRSSCLGNIVVLEQHKGFHFVKVHKLLAYLISTCRKHRLNRLVDYKYYLLVPVAKDY